MRNIRALAIALVLCLLLPCLVLAEAQDTSIYDDITKKLGDDKIAETYAYLKTGATIAQGDKDAQFRGLQSLLNLLGGNLEVDGSIGEKTFDQLTKLVQAYALTPIEALAQMEYEDLLVQAMIAVDPDGALKMLGQDFSQQVQFTKAVQFELKGEYFSAYEQFNYLGNYKDSMSRAAACAQTWPMNGPVIRDSSYSDVDCQLTVKTNREDAQATYFKVFDGEILVCSLFIAGTGEATVNLPKGTYICKAGVGTTWYGPKEAFGRNNDAFYQRLTFEGGADKATMRENYKYTLTLGGADENNVNTEYEDAETF